MRTVVLDDQSKRIAVFGAGSKRVRPRNLTVIRLVLFVESRDVIVRSFQVKILPCGELEVLRLRLQRHPPDVVVEVLDLDDFCLDRKVTRREAMRSVQKQNDGRGENADLSTTLIETHAHSSLAVCNSFLYELCP